LLLFVVIVTGILTKLKIKEKQKATLCSFRKIVCVKD